MSIILVMAILVMAATAAIIVSFTYMLGMYLEGRLAEGQPIRRAADLLFVYVIPCLNEERVIGATLDQLRPIAPDKSVILVVDDGSDDRTAAIVQSRTDENVLLLQRQLPEAQLGKGSALNAALKHLAGSSVLDGRRSSDVIVCLLDADGRLDPEAPEVAGAFFADPRVGGVQVAVRIGNRDDGLLPRLQDMEFVCYTELFQRCRSRAGFAGLGGNGQFTRLSALESLGPEPWSPSILTEDLDLGVRLVLAGWRTHYSTEAEVHQQGLRDIRALVRQRSRWFQGLLQCWILIPHIARKSVGRVRLDMLHMLLTPVLIFAAFLMTLSFLVGPIERIMDPDLDLGGFGLKQLVAWYGLTFFPVLLFAVSYRRITGLGGIRCIALGHAFVIYGLLWVAAGLQAVWRMLAGRRNWIKTNRQHEVADTRSLTAGWGMGNGWHWDLPNLPDGGAVADTQAEGWHWDLPRHANGGAVADTQAEGWHWDLPRHANGGAVADTQAEVWHWDLPRHANGEAVADTQAEGWHWDLPRHANGEAASDTQAEGWHWDLPRHANGEAASDTQAEVWHWDLPGHPNGNTKNSVPRRGWRRR